MGYELAEFVAAVGESARVRLDEPMARHTSFRIGGLADAHVVARTLDELATALHAARGLQFPHLVLGGGSNMLIRDGGVRGVVIEDRARAILGIPGSAPDDTVTIVAESGAPFASLARQVSRVGLTGLEWAVDIPGTVGGAVVNNAGAHGANMAASLTAALILDVDGIARWRGVDELGYGYRTSVLKRDDPLAPRPVVLAAKFVLDPGDPVAIGAAVARYSAHRRLTQPVGASAGSMFKNPAGDYAAGWYVHQAGLRGLRVGQAQVSEMHGNFFLNRGGATATDVLTLVARVQDAVFAQFAVWLELEIQVIGEEARTGAAVG